MALAENHRTALKMEATCIAAATTGTSANNSGTIEKIIKYGSNCNICLVHPIFRFWFLVTFGEEVTRMLRTLKSLLNKLARLTLLNKVK